MMRYTDQLVPGRKLDSVFVGLTAFLVLGCSFMGLGEFDTPELSSNEECMTLNENDSIEIAVDCMVYQYVKHETYHHTN